MAGAIAFFSHHSTSTKKDEILQEIQGATTLDPSESFDTLRDVIRTGGCAATRDAAIAWLDRQVREQKPLGIQCEALLMAMLEHGGHSSWQSGFRQHIYNSACNALRVRPTDGGTTLALQLLRNATTDPDRTIRLYALQHIDSMRLASQIKEPINAEIHVMLEQIAASSDSEVSGTALVLLTQWGVTSTEESSNPVRELAETVAADRKRPVDVRVTALHATGPVGLKLSRLLAADVSEPIILRKAAIARIGRLGGSEDLEILDNMRSENSRIEQAARPALIALRARIASPDSPRPVPYPLTSSYTTP